MILKWILTITFMIIYMLTTKREDLGFLWILMMTFLFYMASTLITAIVITVLRLLFGKLRLDKWIISMAVSLHIFTYSILMWCVETLYQSDPTLIPEDMEWEMISEAVLDGTTIRHYNVGGAEIVTRISEENDEEE